MPHANVNGLDLFYERRGEGEPLLLIMGMSGTHRHWGEPFLTALEAEGFQLILYDHRGIGESERSPGGFTVTDLADDAAGLLTEVGVDTAHVLGLSLGGMVAQELVLRHPDRLRTLTLAATSPGMAEGAMMPPETLQRFGTALASGSWDTMLQAGWELNVSPAYAAREGAYEAFTQLQGDLRVPREVIFAQMQAGAGHETASRLGHISVPTLVLHGEQDLMLPVGNGRVMASLVPGAGLHVFDTAGHMFVWEHPEESARRVGELARSSVER